MPFNPEDLNEEDILNFLHSQQAQQPNNTDLAPEQSLEQLLMSLILNPAEADAKRIRLVDDPYSGIMSEIREKVIINQAGVIEKIQEEIVNVCTLADGSAFNGYGIVRCQNCGGVVKEENTTRCLCGKVICISTGCAKGSGSYLFCSTWHRILNFLGFSLR